MIGFDSEPAKTECSRAGCRAPASWTIEWRNPKIHDESRKKHWIACNDHIDFLRQFLAARDFPLRVLPLQEGTTPAPSDSTGLG